MGPVGRAPRSPWSLTAPAVTSTPNWRGWCSRIPSLPSPPSVRDDPMLRSSRPSRRRRCGLSADSLDGLTEAFGDLADLKCRFTSGSLARRRIARGRGRARSPGSTDGDRARLRRPRSFTTSAAPASRPGSGSEPGPLSAGEVDLVRLHPYWSERVLERSAALRDSGSARGQPSRTARRDRIPPVRRRRGAVARVAAARGG